MQNLTMHAAVLLMGLVVVSSITVNELYMRTVPSSCEQIPLEGRYIWLPRAVSGAFENKTINLEFDTVKSSKIILHGRVGGGKIYSLSCGRAALFDYDVTMRDLDALALATTDKPIFTFQQLRRQGTIVVAASNPQNEQALANAASLEQSDTEPVPKSMQDFFSQFIYKK